MTWTRETTIWCDHEDCGEWESSSGILSDARTYVSRCGWTHRNGKDFCREHSEAAAEEEA